MFMFLRADSSTGGKKRKNLALVAEASAGARRHARHAGKRGEHAAIPIIFEKKGGNYTRRRTMCVISGGAPKRIGAPTVPKPRFTYSADNPLGAFCNSLMVSPYRFGTSGIDSGR